jgi:broad specificity phosphatase PhoE
MSPALWLIRHGESTWNVAGLAQGHNDEAELTSRGLRQAAEAAERFRDAAVRAIYVSDLRRALQTAAAFAQVLRLPVNTDTRLRERSLGVLEGSPSHAIGPAITGVSDGLVVDADARPVGGESVRDLYERAAAFCQDLDLTSAPNTDNSDVLVVAHGGTIRVLTAYLSGVPADQMTWGPVGNAAVTRIPCSSAQPQFGATTAGTQPEGVNR